MTTPGEEAFKAYLGEHGISSEFEKLPEGKKRPPDFTIAHQGRDYFLDVKDINPVQPMQGFGFYDPYKRIRLKIEAATRKFQEYAGLPCALVLHNNGDPLADIWSPTTMLGAMYGDVALRIPFSPQTGKANEEQAERAFYKRGKMIRPGWKEPANTRLSAIISLRYISVGWVRYKKIAATDPSVQQPGAQLDFDPHEQKLGVIVWENAFAATPFPRDLFCGEYDEIYGRVGDKQPSVFAGSGLLSYYADRDKIEN